ncbi:facilitated trehalose transporter Tret1-like isoform X2 [Palaemon carinicauda]|uniref:facilitated trehalose transporter Tret1-like isoform X2 n=1 Tax=Palaemon carinicauda TaxID=392227 RepID=UPI0035B5AC6A
MEEAEEKQSERLTVEHVPQLPKEPEVKRKKRIFMQVLMVLGASIGHLGLAVVAAWPNPAIPELQRNNTNIYGSYMSLNSWQLDMLGSLVSLGNLPGTWIWGLLVANIGRRRSMMFLIVPYSIGWGLVAFAPNAPVLLAGRFFHGICIGATFVSASTYIIELPDTSVRGAMATIPSLVLSCGFILATGLGLCFRWFEIAFVGVFIIVLQVMVLLVLPESPSYLAIKDRENEARVVLKKLRGPSADISQELQDLKKQNQDKIEGSFFKVLQDTDILKSLGIITVLFFVQNFCGLMVFIVNMTRIFIEAGSTLDEKVSSILVFFVQAAGNLLACLYLDRFGRKLCLIASLAVMTMCLMVMAVYHHLKNYTEVIDVVVSNGTDFTTTGTITESIDGMPTWVPLVCLMVYMFTSSIGAGPVPALLNSEYFPTAVRSQPPYHHLPKSHVCNHLAKNHVCLLMHELFSLPTAVQLFLYT